MAQFDCFSPFGVFSFSSEKSECEKAYDSLMDSYGEALQGPVQEALTYGIAMGLGVSQLQLQKAANQSDPTLISDLLPEVEKDYRLYPSPLDSDDERRIALAAAMAISEGATETAITTALQSILGTSFVHYRTLDLDTEVLAYPSPAPAIVPPETPIKQIRITARVMPSVTAQSVAYSRFLDDGNPILTGDILTLDPGGANHEQVTVTEGGASSFKAVITQCHEPGQLGTTQSLPFWSSTARLNMIVVAREILFNRTAMAKIHVAMRKILTAVSTWTVTDSSGGTMGPFTVDGGLIGYTPIGDTSMPVTI